MARAIGSASRQRHRAAVACAGNGAPTSGALIILGTIRGKKNVSDDAGPAVGCIGLSPEVISRCEICLPIGPLGQTTRQSRFLLQRPDGSPQGILDG